MKLIDRIYGAYYEMEELREKDEKNAAFLKSVDNEVGERIVLGRIGGIEKCMDVLKNKFNLEV